MRGMIIGFATLAIAALPTMALADGNGANHRRCWRRSRGRRRGRPGWRGGRRCRRRRHWRSRFGT